MVESRWYPNPREERRQLIGLGLGFAAVAVLLWLLAEVAVLPVILASLALAALSGAAAYAKIGRGCYLIFSVMALAIGTVLSRLAEAVMYVLAIVLPGLVFRCFRMNRLDRSFSACRQRETMFRDAAETDLESFGRQS